jgi:hypothetical protein
VVHVCFVDGDLHTVRFYRNPKVTNANETEDDRFPGECIYNGTWRVVNRSGERGFPPMMYSNREDPRRPTQEYINETEIVSTDLGFGPPQYTDMVPYLQYSHVTRRRYFKEVTTTRVASGEQLLCAVAIPEYVREGYYMAYGDYLASETVTTTTVYRSLVDPNQGYAWRCLPGFGEVTLPGVPDLDPLVCGGNCSMFTTGPQVHSDRRVVYTFRNDYPCSDFADGGQWLNQCMSVEGFGAQPSYPPAQTIVTPPTEKSSGWLKLMMTGLNGAKLLPLTYEAAYRWTAPSPHPTTNEIHKIDATHNALGAEAQVYMTDFVSYGVRRFEGYVLSPLTANDPTPCFIGVYRHG